MKKILKSIKYLILIIDILWLLLFTIDCIRFTQKDVKPLITIKESYEIKYEMGKQINIIQYDIHPENDLTNITYSETRFDNKGNETLLANFTEKLYTNKSKKRMEALATYLRAHPEE